MQVTLQFGGRAASVPRGNSGRRDDRPVVGGCPGRAIRVPGGIGSERHGESTQRPITYAGMLHGHGNPVAVALHWE